MVLLLGPSTAGPRQHWPSARHWISGIVRKQLIGVTPGPFWSLIKSTFVILQIVSKLQNVIINMFQNRFYFLLYHTCITPGTVYIGITPWSFREIIWNTRDWNEVSHLQGKHQPSMLSPVLVHLIYCLHVEIQQLYKLILQHANLMY